MSIDLLSARALSDPHSFLGDLRAKAEVVWSQAHHAWVITSYQGVLDAFMDDRTLTSDRLTPYLGRLTAERAEALGDTFELLRGWMVFNDPPIHRVLRDPVRKAFTPRQMERLRPRIEAIVADLLDDLGSRSDGDLKSEFAFPLPALVIAELMGVEGGDRDKFKRWSAKLAAIVFGESDNPGRDERAAQGTAEFIDYFGWLINRRREEPGDDLISALLRALDDEQARFSELQLIGACTLLLFAGHETTTNLLTNSMSSLLEHTDQADRLRAEPALIDSAVEELLRFDGPVKIMVRAVARTHERGGQILEQGQTVYLSVAGAHRDPRAYDRPDELRIERAATRGNPGLGFGQGPHFCLGASLARLEARIALPAVLSRFPRMRRKNATVNWEPQILTRAMSDLPVQLNGQA